MKPLLTLLTFLFAITCLSQTVAPVGNNNIVQWHKGGIYHDSVMALPVRDRTPIYAAVRYQGRMQVNRSTLVPEFHNGTNWVSFLTGNLSIPRITGLQDSLNSKMAASFVEKDNTVPLFVKSILAEDISRWNNPTFLSLSGRPAAYNSTIALVEGLQEEINAIYAGLSLKMNKGESIEQSQINGLVAQLSSINATISSIQTSLNSKISAESDPVWLAAAPNYRTKAQNDVLYQPVGAYLTSFTELDPTVPAAVKSITLGDITRWNNPPSQLAYTAGTGLSLSGNTFSNSAPDRTVVLSGTGGINVTGTYPSFNVENSRPAPTYYNSSGVKTAPAKVWSDRIAVTSASPSINISSAGFTTTNNMIVQFNIERLGFGGTNPGTHAVYGKIRSRTTTSVIIDLYEPFVLTILGVAIRPITNFDDTFLVVTVEGN